MEDIALGRFIESVRRNRFRLLLLGVLTGAVAFLYAKFGPKVYETHFTLRIGHMWYTDQHNRTVSNESAPEMMEVLQSPAFLMTVKKRLGLKDTPTALKKRIRPYFSERLPASAVEVLTVGVRGPSADEAVRLAQILVDETLKRQNARFAEAEAVQENWERDLQEEIGKTDAEIGRLKDLVYSFQKKPSVDAPAVILLQANLEGRQQHLTGLKERYRGVQLQRTRMLSDKSEIVDGPYAPLRPIKPNVTLNSVLGLFAGPLLFVFLLFLRDIVFSSLALRDPGRAPAT